MYEVSEAMKNDDYRKRIFLYVLETSIYSFEGKAKYIKYWEDETKRLKEIIKDIDPANTSELAETLNQVQQIQKNVGAFLSVISDMKNPECDQIAQALAKALDCILQ
jgi:tRNA A22 N-methylase